MIKCSVVKIFLMKKIGIICFYIEIPTVQPNLTFPIHSHIFIALKGDFQLNM